jgi:hypothetical protein
MKRRIPGSRVAELEAEARLAAERAAAMEDALERERRDAAELDPRRRAAMRAHAEACEAYERARDGAPSALEGASEAIDRLVAARAAMGEARSGVERLGGVPERTTPAFLQATPAGRRALEEIRSKVPARI